MAQAKMKRPPPKMLGATLRAALQVTASMLLDADEVGPAAAWTGFANTVLGHWGHEHGNALGSETMRPHYERGQKAARILLGLES